ncbi:unnamed protein product [Mytilus coruscus]|uniref:Uncharacterized protein n=1 Tax=Mytilus coruscus TaxID=42192 RepID=A0A6J8BL06_MYTCO|nr:unnamed protein product [Mytilus coruscus]
MNVILLLVIAVYIRGVDVCNIKMCLTWTVQKDHLDLTCKVNFLKYNVEFYNNNDNEQGYCLSPKPSPKCIPKYSNTVMRQNATTNVTYLKILDHIDSHFNGKWECRHGTNRDKAFVNITVLQADKWCKRVKRNMRHTCNGSDKGYTHTIIDSVRRGVFLILFIILLVIPVVKGLQDDNICRGEELYLTLGSFLAFIFVIPTIRLAKVNESNEDDDETMHSMEEQDQL